MTLVENLVSELAFTATSAQVWTSVGLAILLAIACLSVGLTVNRLAGLVQASAPAGEQVGMGLAVGLLSVAALWAAISSAGRSSFTPVALASVIAVIVAVAGRLAARDHPPASRVGTGRRSGRRPSWASWLFVSIAVIGVIVVAALVFGATMASSPRNGLQPVEFADVAFYTVLGRDLAASGTETLITPSGFSAVQGTPAQQWYHWGEIWLAAMVIDLAGVDASAARHFVVLPVLVAAVATAGGAVARRLARARRRGAFVVGAVATLLLAPVQVMDVPAFSGSNVGLFFSVTTYGLGAVAVLVCLYLLAVLGRRRPTWGLAWLGAAMIAVLIPAHIALAASLAVAASITFLVHLWTARAERPRLRRLVPGAWRRVVVIAVAIGAASLLWGIATGHGVARGAPPIAPPFNPSWLSYVAITAVGGFLLLAIVTESRRAAPGTPLWWAALGSMLAVAGGAIVWGARVGEFTTFHLFFGPIAVLAGPIGAAAIWTWCRRLDRTGQRRTATLLIVVLGAQSLFGAFATLQRLQLFGPGRYAAIDVQVLQAIEALPADAKLAYACGSTEEIGFATPALLSIDAHTGRRIIPMCFAAEHLSKVVGAGPTDRVPNLYFFGAPQQSLFPAYDSRPTVEEVSGFMRQHGIHFIYADATHPNTLVPDAIPVATVGSTQVLRLP